jgi:four helix bundle protein
MNEFQKAIENKMDVFAHACYSLTKDFPKEEMFGSSSQLRRASLSVILNFLEGFARQRIAVKKNFWEISYGSLKESMYLLKFCRDEHFCSDPQTSKIISLGDEVGAMLWKMIQSLDKK